MAYLHFKNDQIYYEVHGNASSKTVLLLNGIMMNTKSWSKVLRTLKDQFQVVLVDFLGQGQSSYLQGSVTSDQHVENLVSLMNHLNLDSVHVVGTSYGSEIGMRLAYQHPNRVESLVVAAGVSYVDALLKSKVRSWILAAEHAIKFKAKKDFYYMLQPYNYSSKYIHGRDGEFEHSAEVFSKFPDEWFSSLIYLCEDFLNLDITANLNQIKAPTLVIAGNQDELKPVHYSELIQKSIPHCRLEVLPAGHALVIEAQELFTKNLLQFLNSL